MYGENGKLCARIDIKKANQADELELGDETTIVIKGKVKALRGPDEYMSTEYGGKGKEDKEVKRSHPGSIEIEITSMKVAKDGKFDGMLD